ncbi:zinc finger MYM-type protein 1-like [Medicago truncatula]|uniref:zinc finger MYM-type protein 1-like n=1 Tax=Medicago truncatula TaxID=3880 RepID=UPI000D2F2C9A|nr:zinc finger MYM-type protein 1-like [Medicago truncatula]
MERKVKKKSVTLDHFYKKRACESERDEQGMTPPSQPIKVPRIEEDITHMTQPVDVQRIEELHNAGDFLNSLERDPGKRSPIWTFPANHVDEIRRAYLNWGPYQIHLEEYPLSGFRGWKRVRDGKNCAFLKHIGKDPCSHHNNAVKACNDLLNQRAHIRHGFQKQSSSQIMNNRLRLKASIDVVRWLTLQACAFRGHDEKVISKNQGNFLELLKLLASYNDEVAQVVLNNAPKNGKYTCHQVQKELLAILSSRVKKHIREEIGDSKFCIIVDEARDESQKEQMALVLRFVDKDGLIQERFFDMRCVTSTTSLSLKEAVCDILSRHNLDVSNLRGQGYDGASNMRGEWNGLQALFMKDCPYAYYIHCFAHRLQLALVTASREVKPIHKFFEKLTFIVNAVCSSPKRHDELQAAQLKENEYLLEIEEIVPGKGANQIGTVKRETDTRWGSHFSSICSLIRMYEATCFVLKKIAKEATNYSTSGNADSAYNYLKSFDFIFILHLMKEIMGITDVLCQALQLQAQDVVNAMFLVRNTKTLIQQLREDGWDKLLANVRYFCVRHAIEIPDLDDLHSTTRFGRSRLEEN